MHVGNESLAAWLDNKEVLAYELTIWLAGRQSISHVICLFATPPSVVLIRTCFDLAVQHWVQDSQF